MDPEELLDGLKALILESGEEYGMKNVKTFHEQQLLTNNLGLVIIDEENCEHQLSLLGSFNDYR